MTNKSNLILFLSMLLVGLLFLAACGGDSGERGFCKSPHQAAKNPEGDVPASRGFS